VQYFVVVLGESSRNTASAAAQLNDRDTFIESAVSKQFQRPQSFKAKNTSNSALEDRVLSRTVHNGIDDAIALKSQSS
jgi:hypothetical protein